MSATNTLTTLVQKLQPRKDVLSGLRAPGLLAKWPVIGWVMFIFGSLVFAGLTYNLLAQGPLLAWDRVLANTLPAIGLKSPVIVKDLMIAGFHIGREVIIVLGLLLGFFFLYKRYWQELSMVTIGLLGAELLFLSLSTLLARQRPPTQIWNILTIPGFPSGHGISSVTFYGLLAYLLAPKMRSAFWKGAVVVAALFIIGFIGFSRVFTAGHYLTDILAGYAVGIAWSGAVYTLIEIYFRKRSQNVKIG